MHPDKATIDFIHELFRDLNTARGSALDADLCHDATDMVDDARRVCRTLAEVEGA